MLASVSTAWLGSKICYEAVGQTCLGLLNQTKKLVEINHPSLADLKKTLDDLRLEEEVAIADAIVKDIHLHFEDKIAHFSTLQQCLHRLQSTLEMIKSNIEEITVRHEKHSQLWFAYWRQPDCSQQIEEVKKEASLLEYRRKCLLRSSETIRNLSALIID